MSFLQMLGWSLVIAIVLSILLHLLIKWFLKTTAGELYQAFFELNIVYHALPRPVRKKMRAIGIGFTEADFSREREEAMSLGKMPVLRLTIKGKGEFLLWNLWPPKFGLQEVLCREAAAQLAAHGYCVVLVYF